MGEASVELQVDASSLEAAKGTVYEILQGLIQAEAVLNRTGIGSVMALPALAAVWQDACASGKAPGETTISADTLKAVHQVLEAAGWITQDGQAVKPRG